MGRVLAFAYKNLARLEEEQKYSQSYLETGNLSLLRGSLTEFVGEASAGKTSLTLMLLHALTQNGEICSVVDVAGSFNPHAAKKSGVTLENLLWIRCGGHIENAFKAIDYLVQAGNFGLIWLNLNTASFEDLHLIPSSYWYRFRTKVKGSQTLLVVTAKKSLLGSASSQSFSLEKSEIVWSGTGRFKLLKELNINLNTRKPFLIKPEFVKIEAQYV